jgi:hypothetical protein
LTNITNNPANDFNPSWTSLIHEDELALFESQTEPELEYETTFDDFEAWFTYEISDYIEDTYTQTAKPGELNFSLKEPNVAVYSIYSRESKIVDIELDVDFETLPGSGRNSTLLICRASDRGWYEFGLNSGGLWFIRKYDHAINDYVELGSGGSYNINLGAAANSMQASCIGRELTFWINGELIGQTEDIQFTEGIFGVGVKTFEQGNALVSINSFRATTPK